MKTLYSLFILVLFAACTNGQHMNDVADFTTSDHTKAVAVLISAEGHDVSGVITLEETDEGVRVSGNVEGLEGSAHGFHIHEYGDCSAGDFTSAGGHYNPADHPHAGPDADERHMGDMGNLTVNNGRASVDYIDKVIDINDVIGRAVMVHAGEDDLQTQPTGDAGGRIACGVIGIAAQ